MMSSQELNSLHRVIESLPLGTLHVFGGPFSDGPFIINSLDLTKNDGIVSELAFSGEFGWRLRRC